MSFSSLKSGLGVALRNTKASFFANAAADKIKAVQDRWEASVDEKEQTYANLLREMDKNGIRLPTEDELAADLTLGVDYIRTQLSKNKLQAIIDITVKSSRMMSDGTINFIKNKFLNDPEVDRLADQFVEEEANSLFNDAIQDVDAALAGKKPKKRAKTKKNKSSQKLGKLVDASTRKNVERAKSFKRASVADRASLKQQLNAIIESQVIANMGSPALNHWGGITGKGHSGTPFARSVFVDRVTKRTIFYGYNKYPYQVFDPRESHYHNLSSAARNPRRIISAALKDALYTLKVSQPYTYRQDHSL